MELTRNELTALAVLTRNCNGPSLESVKGLLDDPYTWCSTEDLVKAGWGKESAAGTMGALQTKGMVYCEGRDTAVSEKGVRFVIENWTEAEVLSSAPWMKLGA